MPYFKPELNWFWLPASGSSCTVGPLTLYNCGNGTRKSTFISIVMSLKYYWEEVHSHKSSYCLLHLFVRSLERAVREDTLSVPTEFVALQSSCRHTPQNLEWFCFSENNTLSCICIMWGWEGGCGVGFSHYLKCWTVATARQETSGGCDHTVGVIPRCLFLDAQMIHQPHQQTYNLGWFF